MLKEEKQALRCAVRRQIAAFPPEYLASMGDKIAENLTSCPEYQDAQTVLGFVSMKSEPNMMPFLRRVLADGKRLAVPLCTAPGQMEARCISALEELQPGSYGILEPSANAERLPSKELGFIVVPCVACGRQGNRLGHGGGYYDRYLKNYSSPAGLVCCEALLQPMIPMEKFDQTIALVITEAGVYRGGRLTSAHIEEEVL